MSIPSSRVSRLNDGLYFIYWRCGGGSVAALGRTNKGEVWIAPTNWLAPVVQGQTEFNNLLSDAERIELITTQKEACRKRWVKLHAHS